MENGKNNKLNPKMPAWKYWTDWWMKKLREYDVLVTWTKHCIQYWTDWWMKKLREYDVLVTWTKHCIQYSKTSLIDIKSLFYFRCSKILGQRFYRLLLRVTMPVCLPMDRHQRGRHIPWWGQRSVKYFNSNKNHKKFV